MLDIYLNIENAEILSLTKKELYEAALLVIETKLSDPDILLEQEAHLWLLKGFCNYMLQRYPLAIQSVNKILKYRYTNQIEQHMLSQAFFLKAKIMMAHSKGKNQEKNRSTFIVISNSWSLLNFRSENIALMDDFLNLIGKN